MRKSILGIALALISTMAMAQNQPVTKDSVAQLRLNKAATPTIQLRSWDGTNPAGGGTLFLDTADTTTIDNSCTVFVDAAAHRYRRTDAKVIHTDMCDPAGDIGQRVNQAYAALPATGGKIIVDPKADNSCYDYTHGIVFTVVGKVVLLEAASPGNTTNTQAACLNYTPTTATAAITIDYVDGTNGQFASGHGLSNITLVNNNCGTSGGCGSSAIGILIGLDNGGDQGANYTNITVSGFDTGYSELNTNFLTASENWINPSFSGNRIALTILGAAQTFTSGLFAGNGFVFKAPAGSRQAELYFQGTNMYANSGDPNFDFTEATGFGGISMSNVHMESSAANDGAHYFEGHVNVALLNGLLEDDSSSGTGDWMIKLDDNATLTMIGTALASARPYTSVLDMSHLYHALIAPSVASASNLSTLVSGTFSNVVNRLPTTTTTGTPLPWFFGTETSFYQMSHMLSGMQSGGTTLANWGTCDSGSTGQIQYQLDASNTVVGSIAAGSGSSHVFIMCNGSNWVVMGSNDNSSTMTIDTVTALRANAIPAKSINLAGYSSASDGGGGTLVYDPTDTTTADDGVTVFVDAASHRYKRSHIDELTMSMGGAKCDNSSDDTAAFQRVIDAASTLGKMKIIIPRGICVLNSNTELNASNLDFGGYGQGISVVQFNNVADEAGTAAFVHASGTISNISFHDFTIRGTWASNPGELGERCIVLQFIVNVSIQNMECSFTRGFGIACADCRGVRIEHNYVHHSARDAITCEICRAVTIADNVIIHGGDACIAAHTAPTDSTPVRGGLTITGNLCEDVFGIQALGFKSGTVSNNTCVRPKGWCINLTNDGGFGEGETSSHSFTMTGNSASDVIDAPVFGVAFGHSAWCYWVAGYSQPGTGGTVPWRSDGSTGLQTPYGFGWNEAHTSADTIAPGYANIVSNNTCTRTLEAVTNYSDWGFDPTNDGANAGKAFTATGWIDPAVTEGDLEVIGVLVDPGFNHSLITNNILAAGAAGVYIRPDGDFSIDDLTIKLNKIMDAQTFGIGAVSASAVKLNLDIEDNDIDCDPLFKTNGHNADGTWNNGLTSLSAILGTNINGIVEGGNKVKNCFASLRATGSTYTIQQIKPDILYGVPVAINYNAGNVGIGNFRQGNIYVPMNLDSTDADYGTQLVGWDAFGAVPTGTAYHVAGQFKRNIGGSCNSNTVILGWLAITTGSSNTSGTDFIVVNGSC